MNDRYKWSVGDVEFETEVTSEKSMVADDYYCTVEKHQPGKHDQKTHGRVSQSSPNKSLERARKFIPIVKKYGVGPVINAMRELYIPSISPETVSIMSDFGVDIKAWVYGEDDLVGEDNRTKINSVVRAFDNISQFFEGALTTLPDDVKKWTAGGDNLGLDMMWAATQVAIEKDSIVIHRGIHCEKGSEELFNRVTTGRIREIDVDTVGHWSADYNVSNYYSNMFGDTRTHIGGLLFVVNMPKESILFHHSMHDFGFEEEKEVVPIIGLKPFVKSARKSKDYHNQWVIDLEFKHEDL